MKSTKKIMLQEFSDNVLVKFTTKNDVNLGANIEMTRRLKDSTNKLNKSIREFSKSSDRWSLILVFLTLVMLIAVGFQIYLTSFIKCK